MKPKNSCFSFQKQQIDKKNECHFPKNDMPFNYFSKNADRKQIKNN